MAPDLIDLGHLMGRDASGLDAMAEVRRGVVSTGSDENSAVLWLYIGILIGMRFPATGFALTGVCRQYALGGNPEALDRAVVGIARAAGDRQAG